LPPDVYVVIIGWLSGAWYDPDQAIFLIIKRAVKKLIWIKLVG